MANKCDPHEICEECPEWIFTLADLIMCMMGLFVILWVLKPSPSPVSGATMDPKLVGMLAEIRNAFGYVPDPNSTDPVDVAMIVKKIQHLRTDGPGDGAMKNQRPMGAEGADPDVTNIRPGQQVMVGGRVLFEAGDTKLLPEALSGLDQVVTQIRGHRLIVLVKGHSAQDDFPDVATAVQRMDLSLRRAQVVADYLTTHGVDPEVLRVMGCSNFEPIREKAYTSDTRAVNRRAEVVTTSSLVDEYRDRRESAASSTSAASIGPAGEH